MKEILDTNPPINVLESEYKRLLGYPKDHYIDKRALELMQLTQEWYAQNGKPWVYARPSERFEIQENSFKIDGIEFRSKFLLNQLKSARAEMVMLVAVSAGPECELQARQLWLEHKPDEYFFMEMYGSAVVEHLVTATGARFCAWADEENKVVLPHYSPGYSGWDVQAQNTLMGLIEQSVNVKFPEELSVLESGMLSPKKSLIAIFGITKDVRLTQDLEKLIPCENCALPNCSYRRAPFRYSVRLMEDVSKLQPKTKNNPKVREEILDINATYATNANALKKWSESRLKITENVDGTLDTLFRYEGSTCSNMGFPIVYEYKVKLDTAENNYTLLQMSCSPAADNDGYTKMCTYIKNPERLTAAIDEEKPLLGQPVNDIINWQRANRPSGCFCDKSSRYHKWGIVLEVIHYALVQKYARQDQVAEVS
jgi:hypothetical protein